MNDPLIARFAEACGATDPLDLRVDLAGGGLLAEGSIDQPFTLIGRDDACDVTLSDPEINLRHAWVQVLGGRAFAVDLGSRTGLQWPEGGRGSGWLDPGVPVRIGPFLFRLRAPATARPSPYPPDYSPLAADAGAKARPAVALEFRNGRRAKDRWSVNRLITLVGRAPDCKIHLTADDISPYHCGLVSTPGGLWVVDLSGRGVVVNGERMRVAALPQGAELWVGRFLIGCRYQAADPRPNVPPGAAGASGSNGKVSALPLDGARPPEPADEVALGGESESESEAEPELDGLPASHIMAGAFRPPGPNASGAASHPILISGGGSRPAAADDSSAAGAIDDWSLAPLLRQLAEIHDRAGADFQQALALVGLVSSRAKRDQLPVLLGELGRIQELTAEIAALQAQVVRQALDLAALDCPSPPPAGPGSWSSPVTRTPLPGTPPAPEAHAPVPTLARTAERLAALQQDRATRWQALVTTFNGA